MEIAHQARLARQEFEAHAAAGRQIVCVPARTLQFVAVVKAALELPGGPMPLVLVDWQGSEDDEVSGTGVVGIVEAACDGVGVAG